LGPNTGALAWVLGAGGVMVRGITQKIFDNSDAKSCILVTNVFGF